MRRENYVKYEIQWLMELSTTMVQACWIHVIYVIRENYKFGLKHSFEKCWMQFWWIPCPHVHNQLLPQCRWFDDETYRHRAHTFLYIGYWIFQEVGNKCHYRHSFKLSITGMLICNHNKSPLYMLTVTLPSQYASHYQNCHGRFYSNQQMKLWCSIKHNSVVLCETL